RSPRHTRGMAAPRMPRSLRSFCCNAPAGLPPPQRPQSAIYLAIPMATAAPRRSRSRLRSVGLHRVDIRPSSSRRSRKGPDIGHRYDGPTAEEVKRALPWLLEGDPRWEILDLRD